MKKIKDLTKKDKVYIIGILIIIYISLYMLISAPLQTKIICENETIIVNGTISQNDIYKYCNIKHNITIYSIQYTKQINQTKLKFYTKA